MDLLPDWTNLPVANADEAKLAQEENERAARAAWARRFEGARAKIPSRFAWIESLKPTARDDRKGIVFPAMPDVWRERLPWFTPDKVLRFFNVWKSRTNLLLLGPADVGKTCLLVLHAQWTLALASYDATEVRQRREAFNAWNTQLRVPTVIGHGKLGTVYKNMFAPYPGEPTTLPQVIEAQGLRYLSAPQLLDAKQKNMNEEASREAMSATALYLDELGRELYGARPGSHSYADKRVAVMRVVEFRWPLEKRFAATSEHTLDELTEMYGVGSFRRIAGERSGATVIDLADEQWAGPWLRQQKAKTNGRDR